MDVIMVESLPVECLCIFKALSYKTFWQLGLLFTVPLIVVVKQGFEITQVIVVLYVQSVKTRINLIQLKLIFSGPRHSTVCSRIHSSDNRLFTFMAVREGFQTLVLNIKIVAFFYSGSGYAEKHNGFRSRKIRHILTVRIKSRFLL